MDNTEKLLVLVFWFSAIAFGASFGIVLHESVAPIWVVVGYWLAFIGMGLAWFGMEMDGEE